jgi:hypothetical protein
VEARTSIVAWADFWGPILAPTVFALVVTFGTALAIYVLVVILEKVWGKKE